MIVLDQNLFEIDAKDIYGTQVLKTIMNGEVVCDRKVHGNEDVDVDEMMERMMH